jgi:hypothetical protein
MWGTQGRVLCLSASDYGNADASPGGPGEEEVQEEAQEARSVGKEEALQEEARLAP